MNLWFIHPKQPIISIFIRPRPLFLGDRAFVRAAKHSVLFVIDETLTSNNTTTTLTILNQYQEFQDVFEKIMLIFYQNITHIIVPLMCKKVPNLFWPKL